MSDDTEKMQPFGRGTEFLEWQRHNCETCRKGYNGMRWPCDLERRLDYAFTGNGDIPVTVADRIGRHPRGYGLVEKCKEFEEKQHE